MILAKAEFTYDVCSFCLCIFALEALQCRNHLLGLSNDTGLH